MAQLKQNQDNDKNHDEIESVDEIDVNLLAEWIEENQKDKNKENSKYCIVDVRDYDYGPNKIIGSVHIPKDKLIDANDKDNKTIKGLIEKTKNIKNIIFHCRYSMVRGPASAQFYFAFRRENFSNYPKQKVLILHGGIAFWEQQKPKLCEQVEN